MGHCPNNSHVRATASAVGWVLRQLVCRQLLPVDAPEGHLISGLGGQAGVGIVGPDPSPHPLVVRSSRLRAAAGELGNVPSDPVFNGVVFLLQKRRAKIEREERILQFDQETRTGSFGTAHFARCSYACPQNRNPSGPAGLHVLGTLGGPRPHRAHTRHRYEDPLSNYASGSTSALPGCARSGP
jgi:hypothetical protein